MKTFNALLLLISLIVSGSVFAQKNEHNTSDKKTSTEKNVRNLPDENAPHFMQFGIMSRNHNQFKEKYGVSVLYENCVITSYMSEKAKKNNQEVAKYLTGKYGESWKKDLEIIPYGL